jgi:hypothetical protein
MKSKLNTAVAAAGCALALSIGSLVSTAASATTITFSGLAGPNGTPVATYTEGGFTVVVSVVSEVCPFCGQFFQDLQFGNPAPSLLSSAPVPGSLVGISTLDVTANDGRELIFRSIDLAANNGNVSYEFQGVGGAGWCCVSGVEMGRPPGSFGFDTVVNSTDRDSASLHITLIFPLSASVNVDNIVVDAVPGPIAGAGLPGLILAGGGLLGWWRRRRSRLN